MNNLSWSDTLGVGVEEVDDDHRRLTEQLNTFAQAVADQEEPVYLEALLEELISLTIWHFRHEERLMIKYNYEGFDDHREDHGDLVEGIFALRKNFLARDKQVSKEDIEFLEQWLIEHILVTDMPMGRYLAEVM